jgi:hypothetical protein
VKSARLTEFKNNLSRYLDHVKAGGSVMVFNGIGPLRRSCRSPGPGGGARAATTLGWPGSIAAE